MARAKSSVRSAATSSPTAAVPWPRDAEWLQTDGRGGYACGTTADLPQRRYHGLWIVRPEDAARRCMAIAGLDERIVDGAQETSLLHAHWASQPAPFEPRVGVAFALRPCPTWTFRAPGHELERAVLLRAAHDDGGEPMLFVRWRNLGDRPLRLAVRPLLGFCDADQLPAADPSFDGTVHTRGASWGFRPSRLLPTLWLSVDSTAAFRAEPDWYRGFLYSTDRARGYDHTGDRFTPGVLELDVPPHGDAIAAFSFGLPCDAPAGAFAAAFAAAEQQAQALAAAADPLRARLAHGADAFLYRATGGRLGVLAGFPWFGEWGRDVFVALPGLTLARGRGDLCERVLAGALPFLRRGLLPNIYGRTPADSHYGSCDAALWFALAVHRWAAAGGDPQRLRADFVPALRDIAAAYTAGTELGLGVDGDGLLAAGGPDLNATWMDARTARGPVTPRQGLPVEIQALWYSLLATLVEHGEASFAPLRDRCGAAFVRRFWLADGGYLADRVLGGTADRAVRPNMVLAAALPHSPLSAAQRRAVVAMVEAELRTPRGLRTLSPRDAGYRGRYEGDPEQRDLAYHQGTAWPWLGGCYVEAALLATPPKQQPAVRAALRAWLDDFLPELDRAGLDHVSEVFDGDLPQRPGGTFAQAWNTGELLRALALLDAEPGRSRGRAEATA
ncbi:MAG: glycogen debranching enzyme family protein [Planctomycetes bacterium]|nr:glycogen debranching enzyme family protein [Planctomycetota bacterium]